MYTSYTGVALPSQTTKFIKKQRKISLVLPTTAFEFNHINLSLNTTMQASGTWHFKQVIQIQIYLVIFLWWIWSKYMTTGYIALQDTYILMCFEIIRWIRYWQITEIFDTDWYMPYRSSRMMRCYGYNFSRDDIKDWNCISTGTQASTSI